jgi:hypothetical protein
MSDESMQMPPEEGSDVIELDSEIPVRIETLEADGVRPSVGDTVTLRVEGTVKSIEDDCVYVTPEKINDDDLAEILAENAGSEANEDSLMRRLTSEADMGGTPMGGGY